MENKKVRIDENLVELVRAITNRCVIFELVKDERNACWTIATLLEDIFEDAQQIISDYCQRLEN